MIWALIAIAFALLIGLLAIASAVDKKRIPEARGVFPLHIKSDGRGGWYVYDQDPKRFDCTMSSEILDPAVWSTSLTDAKGRIIESSTGGARDGD